MIGVAGRIMLAVIILGQQAAVSIADDVPRLDVARTCRAEASADPNQASATTTACIADEQKAREQLVKEWGSFVTGIRSSCAVEATGIPGIQSYVELLTCLQVARDASKMPTE